MASCPKRGVLNAGDRPAQLRKAAALIFEAVEPFVPRIMPVAQRRAVPASTPMRAGSSVPMSSIGLGNLPPGQAVQGGMPGLGNPGTVPITHGAPFGSGGTSSGYTGPGGTSGPNPFGPGGALAPMVPFITAMTGWAQQVTDAIQAITDTISVGGVSVLWATDMLIGPYTEPMRIWAPDFLPAAIFAGRVINARNAAAPILAGCAVEWDANDSREYIKVRSIDGMAPNDGQTYAFTFLYFGMG